MDFHCSWFQLLWQCSIWRGSKADSYRDGASDGQNTRKGGTNFGCTTKRQSLHRSRMHRALTSGCCTMMGIACVAKFTSRPTCIIGKQASLRFTAPCDLSNKLWRDERRRPKAASPTIVHLQRCSWQWGGLGEDPNYVILLWRGRAQPEL